MAKREEEYRERREKERRENFSPTSSPLRVENSIFGFSLPRTLVRRTERCDIFAYHARTALIKVQYAVRPSCPRGLLNKTDSARQIRGSGEMFV